MSLRKPVFLAAVAVFGFAASLAASAQVEACERCRQVLDDCLLHADSPWQAQACERAYAQCMSPIDCPAPEA